MANSKQLTVINFQPVNEVPDKAPAPKMDLMNPHLSFDDVLPSNYFSMERLQEWLDERSAESRILTVTGCTVEYVYDPEKGVDSGEWKPCLAFEEIDTMLVINVTRGQQLKKLANSPFLADWGKVGQVAIKPGIGNGKAQIVITAVPGEDAPAKAKANGGRKTKANVKDINSDLFGEDDEIPF